MKKDNKYLEEISYKAMEVQQNVESLMRINVEWNEKLLNKIMFSTKKTISDMLDLANHIENKN